MTTRDSVLPTLQNHPRGVLRRSAAAVLVGTLVTGWLAVGPASGHDAAQAAVPLAAAPAGDRVAVDLSRTTGDFRGGASGTLYGLGDEGVPGSALLSGARVTNTSQKPPNGAQHPNGDALAVERSFFAAGGQDLYVYAQDMYPDWAYNGGQRPGDANGDGVWDYLPVLRQVVEDVATKSEHPEKYVFIPFNEPDAGNWYPDWSNQRQQFLADWSAAYQVVQDVYARHGLGKARVGGPGDSVWHEDRSRDLLTYAKAKGQLPDVFIWHELGADSLRDFPAHVEQYSTILRDLGLPRIPVNITEYGALRDMGVPGQLVQWMSMFEAAKVDAQTAYWNYAGNLSDNSSRNSGANGGWWVMKWYGDLAGSRTATVTPPRADVPDSLQALAAVDDGARKATVLLGGGSTDVTVDVSGLKSQVFGSQVDVVVRADRLNGAEGASLQPPVVLSTTATVRNGSVSVTIPNRDRFSAYQVVVTPRAAVRAPVDGRLVSSVEAEATTLSAASAFAQDPTRSFNFIASGAADVGGFNRVTSSAGWPVTAPRTGTYRLSVLAGTNARPGQHALFVDGRFAGLVKYSATLNWGYRGTAELMVPLSAGAHTLSLRASQDGSTVLPGADITLDRFDLVDVTDGDASTYPATEARLSGGAALTWGQGATSGSAALSGAGRATFFAAAAETGYHDVTVEYATTGASRVTLAIDGRDVPVAAAPRAGTWRSTSRVWLTQGINQLTVGSAAGASLSSVGLLRSESQRAADRDPANAVRAEAEALTLAGTATVRTLPASSGSNGSTDSSGVVRAVGYVGGGAGNTATMARPAGFTAGKYVLVLGASNADKSAAINYNPQVVDRFVDVQELGGATTRAAVRHNYSWDSFWDRSVPLDLTTAGGALVLGNATALTPDLDTVTLAKLSVGTPTTTAVGGTTTPVSGAKLYQQVNGGSPVRANVGQPVQVVVQFGNQGTGVLDGTTLQETCRQTDAGTAGASVFTLAPAAGTSQQVARPYPAGQNGNLTLTGTPTVRGEAKYTCTLSMKDEKGAVAMAEVRFAVTVV